MENNFTVKQIGVIRCDDSGFRIEFSPAYKNALISLDGFSYINILWWFSGCDNYADRSVISEAKPYTKGPDTMGHLPHARHSARTPSLYLAPMSLILMWSMV